MYLTVFFKDSVPKTSSIFIRWFKKFYFLYSSIIRAHICSPLIKYVYQLITWVIIGYLIMYTFNANNSHPILHDRWKNSYKSLVNVKKSLTLHINKVLKYDNTIMSQKFSLFSWRGWVLYDTWPRKIKTRTHVQANRRI